MSRKGELGNKLVRREILFWRRQPLWLLAIHFESFVAAGNHNKELGRGRGILESQEHWEEGQYGTCYRLWMWPMWDRQ